ncbi:alpha/beta hydrolase [Myxococcus sp. AS-1-15]|uniref:alpha/beta hydrolase n=1 Tax=Myxococcus sp. AS-1-15 TaxID=2874600 RepID=UPI001CC1520C|nr:alpha/beta hydrolase [Myxococcus sp. AS-1-15]MBZ4396027.1 alpha/beta hydrolase [Myxococcus sp. AS-1-15]BDT37518.1 alpha/beta hydrolase [Myxococcus sp. MH1]
MVRLRRMLTLLLSVLAVLYVALCVAAFVFQRSLLFPAPKAATLLPAAHGFSRLPLSAGAYVDLLQLPGPEGAPTVVHFHGNGEQLLDQLDLGLFLQANGLGFLAVEYPGYGASPGAPSEQGIYAAAEAALALLRTQGVPPERTVLSGRSLGTGVAVEMARRGHGARIMLVAPYTSIPDMAATMLPFLPTSLLVRDRFDTLSKARGLDLPVLIIHGEQDTLIPVEMGRQLGTRFPRATVVTVPDAGHNDVLERSGPDRVQRMAAFALGGD